MTKEIEIQILDYTNDVVGTLDISDSEDFPLAISYTISDGKDLESKYGDFSKSFDIPSTKHNNNLLNYIYNPLIKDDKNISGLKDCRILVGGAPFFVGQIQIKGSKQTSRPESYSATIYGGNFSWVSLLRDKNLCDLTFSSSLSLTYDYADIMVSWAATQATSDIVYPLVSYGDFFPTGSAVAPSVNLYDPYTPNQDWRFWVYVYNMIQEIFKNIGYTISSNFIETANFKKLISYFPYGNKTNEQLEETYSFRTELNGTCTSCCSAGWKFLTGGICGAYTLLSQSQNATNKQVQFPDVISDPSGSWNTGTNKWTCKRSGRYEFNAKFNSLMMTNATFAGQTAVIEANLHLKHTPISTGVQTTIVTKNIWDSTSGTQQFPNSANALIGGLGLMNEATITSSGYIYMALGDIVELQTTFDPYSSTISFNWFLVELGDTGSAFVGASFFEAKYSASQLEIGEDFALQNGLPCDISQVDFIKGISHLFNLYFTTDVQQKIIYVEPFNDFFTKDNAPDWTGKLDIGTTIEDNYDIGLTQEINFKYKEDSKDGYLESINKDPALKNPKTLWYSYYENIGISFKKGITEFENPVFSPTQQEHDDDLTSFLNPCLIPVMWEEPSIVGDLGSGTNPSRPDKGFEFAPRIAYYHGDNYTPNIGNIITRWTKAIGSSFTQSLVTYPRATFVDWEDPTFPSLSYDDETVTPANTTVSTNVEGLYSVYWKNMIEQLKEAPRIRKATINLKIKDILSLDMRKLIYLEGSWWRINKIMDFSPAKKETTKAELIQWIEV